MVADPQETAHPKIKPEDCVIYIDDPKLREKHVVFKVSTVLGKKANGIFAQCNEEMYRKNPGWENRFVQLANQFEQITGIQPESIFHAYEDLCLKKGFGYNLDRQREPFFRPPVRPPLKSG